MSRHPFDPAFAELPDSLPIFPLAGALLLPGGRLPLNIFEPRYLAMVSDALAGSRLIGMVQPRPLPEGTAAFADQGRAPVYATGCAGRIIAFGETDDGRYLITLAGLLRFDIQAELAGEKGYRRVRPDWSSYEADMAAGDPADLDRPRLLAALRSYFARAGIEGDWEAINGAPDEALVTSIAMACPFDPMEKQALLEAPSLDARADTMIAILEMAAAGEGSEARRH